MFSAADNEIQDLIRAGYPLIYVQSWEERRVERAVRRLAEDRGDKHFSWTITQGIVGGVKAANPRDLRDPLKVLEYIYDYREKAIFVLKDFHAFLHDPTVVRKLKDFSVGGSERKQVTVIIISPVLKLPPELEKEVALIDYPLPDLQVLDAVLEGIVAHHNEEEARKYRVAQEDLSQEKRRKVLEAALGLTSAEAENVYAKSLVQKKVFDVDVVLSEKEQIIRKSGVLEFVHATQQFSDVGGLDELKTWLKKRTNAFSQEARDFGLPVPRGILLVGVPGCGKSLTAKAVGALWKQPLLRLDVGKIFAGIVGSSEENMRKAIKTAEAVAPSVLWLDELEKGFSGTHSSSFSDAGTTARVFGSFVTWLQEKQSPVFVIATANNISLLPPELLRKGRFDEIFYVDLPEEPEREEIFRIHLQKRGRPPNHFDLTRLADSSDGYSGSEIEQAIISALYDAFDSGKDLESVDIHNSLEEMIPLSQTMEEEIQRLREWAKTRARAASLHRPQAEFLGHRRIEI